MEFLINNRLYSYSDIRAVALGRLIVGIKEITYKDSTPHEDAPGMGSVSVGYTTGQYKAEASVTLLMAEVEALRRASPTGSIIDIAPFGWTIAYINSDNLPVKHSFIAKFTNDEAGGSGGGAGALESKLELKVIGKINWKTI